MKRTTRSLYVGRHSDEYDGMVNLPVHKTTTVLFPTVDAFERAQAPTYQGVRYGRSGTPTTFALQDAIALLEGAESAVALPSGLAAVTAALLAQVSAGDHVLVTDNAFSRTRVFAQTMLPRFGVETTFFDPLDLDGLDALFRPTTRAILVESPGSTTFEVADLPTLARRAHARGVRVLVDNTWSGSVFYQPLALGADLSIQAASKYIVGHSDALVGIVAGSSESCLAVKQIGEQLGLAASPDACDLALRGLRTLDVRLARHQATGFTVARWLADRPEVERVLHPGLPSCPGHDVWKRDFTGATGLFAIVLRDASHRRVAAMLDGMKLFGIGGGWGGFESLAMPANPSKSRTARAWSQPEPLVRIHCGLEDPSDLLEDLERGLMLATGAP